MKVRFWHFLLPLQFAPGILGAAVVYPLNQTSTAGFFHGVASGQTIRGWDFVVNATGVSVVQMGINEFSNIPITLTLWDNATQTGLAQIVVPAVANTWVFGNLLTPVSLTLGHTYSVVGWADTTTSGVPWYIFNNMPPSAFNPTGTIQYLDVRYDNDIGKDTFPAFTLSPPLQYGVADIGYVISEVPEPLSFTLAATGILLIYIAQSLSFARCLHKA